MILTTILGIGFAIYLAAYLSIAGYIKFGGGDVEHFCQMDLIGRTIHDAAALAEKDGLFVKQQGSLLRVKDNDRSSGHACDLRIDAGKVVKANKTFLF